MFGLKSLLSSFLLLVMLPFLLQCARPLEGAPQNLIQPKAEVKAASEISLSFLAHNPQTDQQVDLAVAHQLASPQLAIRTSALDKEFLLVSSFIPQRQMPTGSGLSSRVVAFQRKGSSVFVIEANQGHQVSEVLPAQLILAELPILKETDDTVVVDFNKGMAKVFVAGGWTQSEAYNPKEYDEAFKIESGFIAQLRLVGERMLEIRQINQLDFGGGYFPSYEVRYYISPYQPDPNFQPQLTSDFKNVGYFEVPSLLEPKTGRAYQHITKWNLTKGPIVYHVSANTPAWLQQAVQEGILYWNTVFGKEVLRAEMAPEGVTAPDPRYNLVQWVEYETAGFAYADALADPRTGEILHAQVFLTSVFAARDHLLERLRRIRTGQEQKSPEQHFHKHHHNHLCDYDLDAVLNNRLVALAKTDLTDDAIFERLVRDTIRNVVAHEVGHTLGLRHNFAGSLALNISPQELQRHYEHYVLTGKLMAGKETVYGSSVMEYQNVYEDVLTGAQIKSGQAKLAYDNLAIQWGYFNQKINEKSAPLFCTDHEATTSNEPVNQWAYLDCQQFDSGANVVLDEHAQIEATIKVIPHILFNSFVNAQVPRNPRDKKELHEVSLPIERLLSQMGTGYEKIVASLSDKTQLLSVQRSYPYVSGVYAKDYQQKTIETLVEQLLKTGNAQQTLFKYLPNAQGKKQSIVDLGKAQLKKILSDPRFHQGHGPGGTFAFGPEELAFIEQEIVKALVLLEEKWEQKAIKILAQGKFSKKNIQALQKQIQFAGLAPGDWDVEKALGDLAFYVLTSKGEQQIWGPVIDGQPAKAVALRKYAIEDRKAAIALLSPQLSDYFTWSQDSRDNVKSQILMDLSAAVGELNFEKAMGQFKSWPRDFREYWLEQMIMMGALEE